MIQRRKMWYLCLLAIAPLTVTINQHSLLCEIQYVTVQNFPVNSVNADTSNVLSEIYLPKDELVEEQQQKVHSLLTEFELLFSKGDDDIGYCPFVELGIDLLDETPFKQRFRRIPPSMMDEVKKHIKQQLAAGIIRRSHSPFTLCSSEGKMANFAYVFI